MLFTRCLRVSLSLNFDRTSVDIKMDVGKSLNPAIDYGQMYISTLPSCFLLPSLTDSVVLFIARARSSKVKDG